MPKPLARKRRFATLRAILALMLREMSTSYGRSPGGYLWAVAEPVAAVAFLTLVFSLMLPGAPIGASFPMFYATGMMPFMMFNTLHNKVSQALMYSKPLLAYPNVTFFDALIARFILTALTEFLVAYLLFALIILFFEGRMHIDLWMVVRGHLLAAFLGLGLGTVNAYVFLRLPVWQQVWSVLTRPLFLFSCTMIMYDAIPMPYRDWLWWNPLVHVVGVVRAGFYDSYDAYYVSEVYVLMLAMGSFAAGLLLLRRHYRDLFEHV